MLKPILVDRDIRILLDLGMVMTKKHTMEVVDIQCTGITFESTHSKYTRVRDHESLLHKFHIPLVFLK